MLAIHVLLKSHQYDGVRFRVIERYKSYYFKQSQVLVHLKPKKRSNERLFWPDTVTDIVNVTLNIIPMTGLYAAVFLGEAS